MKQDVKNEREINNKCSVICEVLSELEKDMMSELYATDIGDNISKSAIKDCYYKKAFAYLISLDSLSSSELKILTNRFRLGTINKALNVMSTLLEEIA